MDITMGDKPANDRVNTADVPSQGEGSSKHIWIKVERCDDDLQMSPKDTEINDSFAFDNNEKIDNVNNMMPVHVKVERDGEDDDDLIIHDHSNHSNATGDSAGDCEGVSKEVWVKVEHEDPIYPVAPKQENHDEVDNVTDEYITGDLNVPSSVYECKGSVHEPAHYYVERKGVEDIEGENHSSVFGRSVQEVMKNASDGTNSTVQVGVAPLNADGATKSRRPKKSKRSSGLDKARARKAQFPCHFCSEVLRQSCDLERHIHDAHPGMKPYKCDTCKNTFSHASNLQRHTRTVHFGVRGYTCKTCNKTFTQSANLRKHMEGVHSGNKPYLCSVCNKGFSQTSSLRIHLRIHSGVKPFTCTSCNKAFNQKSSLLKHFQSVHSDDKTFPCHMCGETFTQKIALRSHLKTHPGLKQFPCHLCDKAFSQNKPLQKHLIIHSGEKPFACHMCSKSFNQTCLLRKHVKGVHIDKKLYVCDVCKKTFGHKRSYQSHLLVHAEKKLFVCDACKKGFNQRSKLQKHIQAVHLGLKQYTCELCKKAFSEKNTLKEHLLKHSGKRPYSCEVCGKTFVYRSSIRRHIMRHSEAKGGVAPE